MSSLRKLLLSGLVAFLAAAGCFAAEASVPPARPTATSPELQKLVEQFSAKRETILASYQALLAQLKTATEDQKKAILAKMEAQQKDLLENQRALGKQIRDEMRKLRQNAPTGPHR
jgi:hypothetical protein